MPGDGRSRRRLLQTAGAALLAGLAGCNGSGNDDEAETTTTASPATTTTTRTTTTTDTTTTTKEPAESLPYERTLSDDHPLVRWTVDTKIIDGVDLFTPAYSSPPGVREHIGQLAGEPAGIIRGDYQDWKRFFNLGREQVAHWLSYGGQKIKVWEGEFDEEQVTERLKERANDKGTRRGYRVFRRFTDRLQYPYVLGVDDGVLILAGGELDTNEWAWFEYAVSAETGEADSFLKTNEYARKAYAPMGGVDTVRGVAYTPTEARETDGPLRGMRMWTFGHHFSDGQVRTKVPMVFGDGYEVDIESIRRAFSEFSPAAPYDYEITAAGQVAYFEGTAPIGEYDSFTPGSPEEEYDDPDERDENPDNTDRPAPPENTRWSFETDYETEETTVTYVSGPTIENRRLLGVALNNTALYETQFRSKYDRPIQPGDSITVQTPPKQGGEDLTVSWLWVEPYTLLAVHDLPDTDSTSGD